MEPARPVSAARNEGALVEFVVQVASCGVDQDLAVAPKAAAAEIGQSPIDIDPRKTPKNGGGESPVIAMFASPGVPSSSLEPEVAALRAGKPVGGLIPKRMLGGEHLSFHSLLLHHPTWAPWRNAGPSCVRQPS